MRRIVSNLYSSKKLRRMSATQKKVANRRRLATNLGLQQGTDYSKQRAKLENSYGYLRTGNVRHFINAKPKVKTRDKSRYGKSDNLSRHDKQCMDKLDVRYN